TPAAFRSRRRSRLLRASAKSVCALRASACACPKSGENSSASGSPALTTSPGLTRMRATRPANGGYRRTVRSSSQTRRPVSLSFSGAPAWTTSDCSAASCGLPSENTTRPFSRRGGGASVFLSRSPHPATSIAAATSMDIDNARMLSFPLRASRGPLPRLLRADPSPPGRQRLGVVVSRRGGVDLDRAQRTARVEQVHHADGAVLVGVLGRVGRLPRLGEQRAVVAREPLGGRLQVGGRPVQLGA